MGAIFMGRLDRRAFLQTATAASILPVTSYAHSAYRAPRTSFGTPSFEGIWTNASFTRLERPKAFNHLVISEYEARKAEAIYRSHGNFDAKNFDPLGQKDSENWQTGDGLARVRGEIRTSWIVDPADGRLPFTPDAINRFHFDDPDWKPGFDNPEERPVTERCVASEGGYPPQLNSPDGNFMQVVQTADHVAILIEKYHDVHIIRTGKAHHAPAEVRSWMGDAVGRWEGETLVVENTNFCVSGLSRYGRLKLSTSAVVIERFTRISPVELIYQFSVSDPALYTQTWHAEMPFFADKGPIYEYTCHEGNSSLKNEFLGERLREGRKFDGFAKSN
jgi:hypothetical protein